MVNTESNTKKTQETWASYLKEDFIASIVVFLVALPLCIGIAVAVGVSPGKALITGIVGGAIVGFFAGSPLQVSGPAAGLFVTVADLINRGKESFVYQFAGETESPEAVTYSMLVLGTSVFLAGLIQVGAGFLKLGQWFRAVSPAVIKGMLAGIGVLILLSQFHVMLDHQAMYNGHKAHGGLQYLASIPDALQKVFTGDHSDNHHLAALTGVITISVILFWPLVAPKQIRLVPAALVAITIASVFATVAGLEIQKLNVAGSLVDELHLPTTAVWFQLLVDPIVINGAIVIALIASAETLLCATAVDQLHNGQRTNYDKELTAQGIGNTICGLLGVLPMTGVIVRSSANVEAGAKTRASTIMHGFWLLIFVAFIPTVLTYIPRSALGALLVYTGIKLVNIKQIKNLWKAGKGEVAIYFITVAVIVCEDLLIGVVVGIVLSTLKLLHRFSHLEIERVETSDGVTVLKMEGAATFLRLPVLAGELEKVTDSTELHVDFEHVTYIDHACLELLMTWAEQHRDQGGKLVLDWDKLHARFRMSAKDSVELAKKKRHSDEDLDPAQSV